jgi:hypothetical protein
VRSFLRFAGVAGLVDAAVLDAVPAVRSSRQVRVPSVWDPADVARILEAIDRGNPCGKRDYAIILLVTRLGLRGVDVKRLEFADFDWPGNRLGVVQAKTGDRVQLPLLKEVGWAVIDYPPWPAGLRLPAGGQLPFRLADGIRVADVGCGTGHAINLMARAYPRSAFFAYDLAPERPRQCPPRGRRARADEHHLRDARRDPAARRPTLRCGVRPHHHPRLGPIRSPRWPAFTALWTRAAFSSWWTSRPPAACKTTWTSRGVPGCMA